MANFPCFNFSVLLPKQMLKMSKSLDAFGFIQRLINNTHNADHDTKFDPNDSDFKW